ncbi:hypothetical protein BDV93DRAFT_358866 [Ceratobasidium sp. AG-I]|nr:hypothetical protein BDV93DRAFT_358866 [Ceratobasidium sp. AG-I]
MILDEWSVLHTLYVFNLEFHQLVFRVTLVLDRIHTLSQSCLILMQSPYVGPHPDTFDSCLVLRGRRRENIESIAPGPQTFLPIQEPSPCPI